MCKSLPQNRCFWQCRRYALCVSAEKHRWSKIVFTLLEGSLKISTSVCCSSNSPKKSLDRTYHQVLRKIPQKCQIWRTSSLTILLMFGPRESRALIHILFLTPVYFVLRLARYCTVFIIKSIIPSGRSSLWDYAKPDIAPLGDNNDELKPTWQTVVEKQCLNRNSDILDFSRGVSLVAFAMSWLCILAVTTLLRI